MLCAWTLFARISACTATASKREPAAVRSAGAEQGQAGEAGPTEAQGHDGHVEFGDMTERGSRGKAEASPELGAL